MFTVAELTAAMEGSGRRLTPRTARNWWSVGILPRPERTGLGQGVGTVSFWRNRRVLFQAQIAHDLLSRGVSLQGAAAGLWLVGFPAPIKVVREAFGHQIAGHFPRGRGRSRDGLEEGSGISSVDLSDRMHGLVAARARMTKASRFMR